MAEWWEKTSMYHIYPRSFLDTNGDGVGDLRGVLARLGYLQELGVETLWLSPFYTSPQRDHGYDIADYRSIDPLFGTMDDALDLIRETHRRGMKIIFDMVMNHTSDQHPWFLSSRSSEASPYRDYYIWKKGRGQGMGDGKAKRPPNNWVSMLGKPAWKYDGTTDAWYYFSYLYFQPDLNYDNPEVRKVMLDTVRFWLDKGVDGFRLDIFNCIGKDDSFADNPPSLRYAPTPDNNDRAFFQNKKHSINHPKSFAFARELRTVLDEYPGRFLLGEISGSDGTITAFLDAGLHTANLFQTIQYRFTSTFFASVIERMERHYQSPRVPTIMYSTHDAGRGMDRIGGDRRKARVLAFFQMTSRGIPILYYGDEIGMRNADIPMREAQDPLALQNSGVPKKLAALLGIFLNRDDCRTPMQWSDTPYAGFSVNRSWLQPVGNYQEVNVERQEKDPLSLLALYRALFALRKKHEALSLGNTAILDSPTGLLVYLRNCGNERFMVVLNFSAKARVYTLDSSYGIVFASDSECGLIAGQSGSTAQAGELRLPPHSACILAPTEFGKDLS